MTRARALATAMFALALTVAFTQSGMGAVVASGGLMIGAIVVLSRDGALTKQPTRSTRITRVGGLNDHH